MNCGDWEERLALYVGGDLVPDEAAAVERHLGECTGCQLFASGLKEGLELVQEVHREPLVPAHFAVVRARVLAELEGARRPFWRRGWVYGLALAAAVLLAVIGAPKRVAEPPVVAMRPAAPASLGSVTTPAVESLRAPGGGPSEDSSNAPHADSGKRRRARRKSGTGEPVMVRVLTGNPDVVIYWIADSRGE